MGLSVASLNPIRSVAYVTPQQQAYSIDNEAAISSSYRESLQNTSSPEAVRGAAPVIYTNARYDVSAVDAQNSASQRANRAYNAIADSFGGVNTTYGRGGDASSYALYGQNIDFFA